MYSFSRKMHPYTYLSLKLLMSVGFMYEQDSLCLGKRRINLMMNGNNPEQGTYEPILFWVTSPGSVYLLADWAFEIGLPCPKSCSGLVNMILCVAHENRKEY